VDLFRETRALRGPASRAVAPACQDVDASPRHRAARRGPMPAAEISSPNARPAR
jgi:hypothetical protein